MGPVCVAPYEIMASHALPHL